MAKTKTISITSSNYVFSITPSTKNANYVYDSSLGSNTQNVSFNPIYGKKYTGCRNITLRKENDLIVYTKFLKDQTVKKTVTSTIKNYYTDTHKGSVMSNGSSLPTSSNMYNYFFDETFSGKTYENGTGYSSVMGNNKSNTYYLSNAGGDKIYDEKGNETYNISHSDDGEQTRITDYSGKDKYNMSGGGYSSITDYSGGDKYTLESAKGYFTDMAGNDKYTLTAVTDSTQIQDYKGTDKYYFYNSDKAITARDYSGKDKYTVNGQNGVFISDDKSNDSYSFKNVSQKTNSTAVMDKAGNDKYTFDNVDGGESCGIGIIDYSGKDKYTIKNSTNTGSNKRLTITDGYAPEGTLVSGDDKYYLTSAAYTEITDHGGKNKFTVKSSFVRIAADGTGADTSNNDTYSVSGTAAKYKKKTLVKEAEYATGVIIRDGKSDGSNSSNDTYNYSYYQWYTDTDDTNADYNKVDVVDYGGSDTYNIKNTKGIRIRDYQTTDGNYKNTFNVKNTEKFIIDVSGKNAGDEGNYIATNDTYNIVSSSGSIYDYSLTSNDTYKIDKLSNKVPGTGYVFIQDHGGNDTLTITGAKAKNLVFMSDGGLSTNLYIYDKKDHGFVVVGDYFGDWYHGKVSKDTNDKYIYNDTSAYRIETIKADKTNVNSMIMSATEMNNVKSQVASWLNDYGTSNSMVTSLKNAADNTHINELIAIFTKQ